MPHRMLPLLGSERVLAYRDVHPHCDDVQIGEIYAWQASLASAWHETLGHAEIMLRNAIDAGLARWNTSQAADADGPYGSDWLIRPASRLKAEIESGSNNMLQRVRDGAEEAKRLRPHNHPRKDAAITHSDLLARITFGNMVALLPATRQKTRVIRPTSRIGRRDNLWLHGVRHGFPHVDAVFKKNRKLPEPISTVHQGFRVALVVEDLRRLRNRIAHHDQILTTSHELQCDQLIKLVKAIDLDAAAALRSISRVQDSAVSPITALPGNRT